MKFEDKADRHKRWHMIVVSANRAPVHPLPRETSWDLTLEAYGVPSRERNRRIKEREDANRLAERDPAATVWFEHNGLRIEYRQSRIS
ncbi:hypothetical protein ACVOZ6_003540 [Escherichia coli]